VGQPVGEEDRAAAPTYTVALGLAFSRMTRSASALYRSHSAAVSNSGAM
jgi:hypothetical protein